MTVPRPATSMLRQSLLILMLCLTVAAVDAAARRRLSSPSSPQATERCACSAATSSCSTSRRTCVSAAPCCCRAGWPRSSPRSTATAPTSSPAMKPSGPPSRRFRCPPLRSSPPSPIGQRGGAGALLALSPDERLLYTANSATIAVVDVAANAVVRQQLVGGVIDAFAVSVDGTKLYIPGGSQLRAVDTSTFGTTLLPYPRRAVNVVPSPDGSRLYSRQRGRHRRRVRPRDEHGDRDRSRRRRAVRGGAQHRRTGPLRRQRRRELGHQDRHGDACARDLSGAGQSRRCCRSRRTPEGSSSGRHRRPASGCSTAPPDRW